MNSREAIPEPKEMTRRSFFKLAGGAGVAAGFAGLLSSCAQEIPGIPPEQPESTKSTSPESSTPSQTPTKEATTPKVELPFDQKTVDFMEGLPIEKFERYDESDRIGYALAAYNEEANNISLYAHMIDQKTANGRFLYEYNPLDEFSTSDKSDGQEIMNSIIYRIAFAMAHEDPLEVKKLISGVVRKGEPSSKVYKDYVRYYSDRAGAKLAQNSVTGDLYNVQKTDFKQKANPSTGASELYATIYTKGLVIEAVYIPRKGISENNRDWEDDGEMKGIWLTVSEREAKVTVE